MHSRPNAAVNCAVKRKTSGGRKCPSYRTSGEIADIADAIGEWRIKDNVVITLLPLPRGAGIFRYRRGDRVEAGPEHTHNPVTRSAGRSPGPASASRASGSTGACNVAPSTSPARCERRHQHCGDHHTLSCHRYAPVRKVHQRTALNLHRRTPPAHLCMRPRAGSAR